MPAGAAAGLNFIRLATPTTDDGGCRPCSRTPRASSTTCRSPASPARPRPIPARSTDAVARIKRHTDLPVAVGFGVRTGAQAREIAAAPTASWSAPRWSMPCAQASTRMAGRRRARSRPSRNSWRARARCAQRQEALIERAAAPARGTRCSRLTKPPARWSTPRTGGASTRACATRGPAADGRRRAPGRPLSLREAATWLQRASGHPLRQPVGDRAARGAGGEPQHRRGDRRCVRRDRLLTVVCGGRQGIMAAVCRGVAASGGVGSGLLPETEADAAKPHVGVPLATGIGEARQRHRGAQLRSAWWRSATASARCRKSRSACSSADR